MPPPQAYIAGGVRTPIGKFGGALSSVRADDLAAHAIRVLLERYPDLNPTQVDDVVLGCANQAGEDNRNVARMALLLAGLPCSVPGETVNRLCASGMSAAVHCANATRLRLGDLFVAGGVEHMTRAPYVLSKAARPFGRDAELFDTSIGWRFVNPKMRERFGVDAMGETAENVAELLGISRERQDRFAAESQRKATDARERGRFAREITPIEVAPAHRGKPAVTFSEDEFIRPDTTPEVLAKLRPAFRSEGKGTVTAGNASGINDGACALLIGSQAGLTGAGAAPLARIVTSQVVGVEPRLMGLGPVKASQGALERAGLTLSEIDIIELNEAFAVQVLGCLEQLGIAEDDSRVNPNGGAIALGHPLGMSGARLLLTAALELQERQTRYALCTMCVGVGQGMAVVLERVEG
jgi:3-oxo-5,6-didehydrosuberyl-CoA/3-oxoadipyl-CoA thiolase